MTDTSISSSNDGLTAPHALCIITALGPVPPHAIPIYSMYICSCVCTFLVYPAGFHHCLYCQLKLGNKLWQSWGNWWSAPSPSALASIAVSMQLYPLDLLTFKYLVTTCTSAIRLSVREEQDLLGIIDLELLGVKILVPILIETFLALLSCLILAWY